MNTLPVSPVARIVCVGGLDPGGGAGIVRDYLSVQALGARATLVATAWTTQSHRGVVGFEARGADAVGEALAWALGDLSSGPGAVKVGMVATPSVLGAVVAALRGFSGPVVFDPVMAASSGGSLLAGVPADLMPLVRRATLVTPNLAEAAALSGQPVTTLAEAEAAARRLRELGAPAVLVKGGHLPGESTDLLLTDHGESLFSVPSLPGRSPRGTGCALGCAIAVGLARGQVLPEAIRDAKAWLTDRIRDARFVGVDRFLGD